MTGFFVTVALIVGALIGLYWLWTRKVEAEIVEGAEVEWNWLNKNNPDKIKGHDETSFRAIYRKVHFPRFPKYFLGIIACFALALPVVFAALSGSLWMGEKLGIVAEPAELAKYVPLTEGKTRAQTAEREERALYLAKDFTGFYYYFGLFAAWLTIVAVFMWAYHKRAPSSLREELIRARE